MVKYKQANAHNTVQQTCTQSTRARKQMPCQRSPTCNHTTRGQRRGANTLEHNDRTYLCVESHGHLERVTPQREEGTPIGARALRWPGCVCHGD
jgi:hypothetical protein